MQRNNSFSLEKINRKVAPSIEWILISLLWYSCGRYCFHIKTCLSSASELIWDSECLNNESKSKTSPLTQWIKRTEEIWVLLLSFYRIITMFQIIWILFRPNCESGIATKLVSWSFWKLSQSKFTSEKSNYGFYVKQIWSVMYWIC